MYKTYHNTFFFLPLALPNFCFDQKKPSTWTIYTSSNVSDSPILKIKGEKHRINYSWESTDEMMRERSELLIGKIILS